MGMSFDVSADAYDRFMGRYSVTLSAQLADLAGVAAGQRALDVGCGSGRLTAELSRRLGASAVAAIDPSEQFVEAMRGRHPGVDVRHGVAEHLPFADGAFDAALAQLVMHFMTDPVAGVRDMARVTRSGGAVAVSVWDLAGGRAPMSPFWRGALALDPAARSELNPPSAGDGRPGVVLTAAGLQDVSEVEHRADVAHPTFDDWWQPFSLGVGPAGVYLTGLDAGRQAQIRDRCHQELGDGPFTLPTVTFAARGTVV
jgi:SAM-dependent methyltransferase